MTVVKAEKTTVLVPAVNVAFAAVTVQLPPTLIVDPSATRVPFVPSATEPAVTPKLEIDVSRTVFPVGEATELRTVRSPDTVRAFVASV